MQVGWGGVDEIVKGGGIGGRGLFGGFIWQLRLKILSLLA